MKKEYLLATFTVFCWGTLPAVTKLTLLHISNMQVLFISSLIATVSLLLYLLFTGRIMGFRSLRRVDLVQLTALGFLGNFLYSAFYYAGVRMLPTADASTVNYLWPVIASVSAVLILKEKINRSGWLAIIVSFLGVTVISSGGTGPTFKNIHGVALCAAGAFCYGIFNVLNKKKGPGSTSLYNSLFRCDCTLFGYCFLYDRVFSTYVSQHMGRDDLARCSY